MRARGSDHGRAAMIVAASPGCSSSRAFPQIGQSMVKSTERPEMDIPTGGVMEGTAPQTLAIVLAIAVCLGSRSW
jgi:hypothetical protein